MSPRQFTGRARRRQTSWSVRLGDRFAKNLITVGGIGTIVAVSLVFAYLVTEVAPLFLSAKVRSTETLPVAQADGPAHSASLTAAPIRIGLDEFGTTAWLLYPDGRIRVIALEGEATLRQLSPDESGLKGLTSAVFSVELGTESSVGNDAGIAGPRAVFGFADGTVRPGRLGFATRYLDPNDADIPAPVRNVPYGQVEHWSGGTVTRTRIGQLRMLQFAVQLEDPAITGDAKSVVAADQTTSGEDTVLGVLWADGHARVQAVKPKSEFAVAAQPQLGDGADLPIPTDIEGKPRFLVISGLADYAYVAWEDGRLLRFEIRDLAKPRLVEDVRLLDVAGAKLTTLQMLLGGYSLIAGDSTGAVRSWFPVRNQNQATVDGRHMVMADQFPSTGSAVTSLISASTAREVVAGHADGRVQLLHVTSDKAVVDVNATSSRGSADSSAKPAVTAVAISPSGNRLLAATDRAVSLWQIDQGHPDATFRTLFLPVWYEGEPAPLCVWQTSGPEGFEPKYSLAPLIFGTLKATFFAMIFGAPLALLAAVYTSEFLHPATRAKIKPTIEMMASLPSVVLGFLAGLVFAPVMARIVPQMIMLIYTVPLALLLGAYLWQLLPQRFALRLARWRFAVMTFVAVPLGVWAAFLSGPRVEAWLFSGDIKGWLTGQHGSAAAGWIFLLMPLSAIAVAIAMGRFVNPWIRSYARQWSRRQSALVDLAKFLGGLVSTLVLVSAVSWALTAIKIDPRASLLGKYEQLNALVVGVAMGFAIIPLIYTIADDALTTVPTHLRSASLGCGATPWQTATRIVIPTAMSGLFSAVMIGLGRAVGETMIVLMAAGGVPIFDWNPFAGMQTLSAAIASQMPEAAVGSTHARVLYLAALALFVVTFFINTLAEVVRQRFRRRAYDL